MDARSRYVRTARARGQRAPDRRRNERTTHDPLDDERLPAHDQHHPAPRPPCPRRLGVRDVHGRRCPAGHVRDRWPTTPTGSPPRSAASGSARAIPLARSCGTTRSTSRRTSPSRAWALCSTRSTSACREQLVYVTNHAGDRVVLVDASLLPVIGPSRRSSRRSRRGSSSATATRRRWSPRAARCTATTSSSPLRRPASTTRNRTRTPRRRCVTRAARRATPKASCTRIARRTCTRSRPAPRRSWGWMPLIACLAIVPQFHANAWGMPYAAFLSGRRCSCLVGSSRPSRWRGSSPPSDRRSRPRCPPCGPILPLRQ